MSGARNYCSTCGGPVFPDGFGNWGHEWPENYGHRVTLRTDSGPES